MIFLLTRLQEKLLHEPSLFEQVTSSAYKRETLKNALSIFDDIFMLQVFITSQKSAKKRSKNDRISMKKYQISHPIRWLYIEGIQITTGEWLHS